MIIYAQAACRLYRCQLSIVCALRTFAEFHAVLGQYFKDICSCSDEEEPCKEKPVHLHAPIEAVGTFLHLQQLFLQLSQRHPEAAGAADARHND